MEEPVGGGGFLHGLVDCWLQRDLVAVHSSGSVAGISTFKPAPFLNWNITLSFLSSCQGWLAMGNKRQAGHFAGWWWVLVSDAWEVFAKYKDPACVLRLSKDDEFTSGPITWASSPFTSSCSWQLYGCQDGKFQDFCQPRIFQLVAERALRGTSMQLSGLDFHTDFYLTLFTGVRDFVSQLS